MDRLDYVSKWINEADKYKSKQRQNFLAQECERWSDWLWLGRHYHNKKTGVFNDTNIDIAKQAYEEAEKLENKYKDDPDFIEYMCERKTAKPDEEFGDTCWREISMNVGALRWLLTGEWFLDS